MQPVHESVDVIIVGAGICGVSVARLLQGQGTVTWNIIDKGRSVGGRMATRRVAGERFDHGAQFFTARSDNFKSLIECLSKEGVVKDWVRGFKKDSEKSSTIADGNDGFPRYVGVEGMNQVVKHLAAKLPSEHIHLQEKLIGIDILGENLGLRCESGNTYAARTVLLTMPLPQVNPLLDGLSTDSVFTDVLSQIRSVDYDPCVALMGYFSQDEIPMSLMPYKSENAPISFVSDNYSKGISKVPGSLTIHLSPEASRGLFATENEFIKDFVCEQLGRQFGIKTVSKPTVYEVQKWRYAAPQAVLGKPFLSWQTRLPNGPKIFVAGEAFSGPKIEGAYLSALAVSAELLGS